MSDRLNGIFVKTGHHALECERLVAAQQFLVRQGDDRTIVFQALKTLQRTHAMLKSHCDQQRRVLGIAPF